MMTLPEAVSQFPKILAECAITEQLRRRPVTLHNTLFNTPLIYGPEDERDEMTAIYRSYLDAAVEAELPLLLTAPTWRLDVDRTRDAGFPLTINSDAVAYLQKVRDTYASHSKAPVLVGALLGPQNDCYQPKLAPDAKTAEKFHSTQINALSKTSTDFLLAQTLPSVDEAIGMARAIAKTDTPYIISFCTGVDGHVLDGTSLPEAMRTIDRDSELAHPPAGYFVNCTHPGFLLKAYPNSSLDRLIGIQANGSSKDVTSLDGARATVADTVESWTDSMMELHRSQHVPILGGCCGTSLAHMEALIAAG